MTSTTAVPTLRQVIDRHLRRADPRVLTAHDRLDVPVGWVHSSEIFEIGPLLAGGELLLTTGLGLSGLDAGTRRHYVRDLAERGVAGLAFEIGRTFDAVPDEMLREGSSARLPIIELRHVLPFIEVCREANTAIVSGELAGLRLRSELDDALHHDLMGSGGVAGMLSHVAAVTGRSVVLIGSGGALIAAHGVDDDRSAWRIVDSAVASAPVAVRGREIARLVAGLDAANRPRVPDDQVATLLSVATGPLASALTRSGTRGSALGAQLVSEIVAGRPVRRADLFARLAGSGVPVSDSVVLVTVAAEAPDPRMAEAILSRVAVPSAAVIATVDATVYALVPVTDSSTGDDPVERVAAAIATAVDPGARITAIVGDGHRLGDVQPGPELSAAISRSLLRCAERLDAASLLTRGGRKVFTSRELAADAAIRTTDSAVRQELREMVAPLIAHDAAQSTHLVATLETHLRHGCSATRSAEALHIGRQSLYQRLERIRGLLGFDPTAAAMYPSMMLAVSAFRTSDQTADGQPYVVSERATVRRASTI